MAKNESDNESVESGSCTCSDYDSDCSWFYDSRKLGTSYMRFCIISDNDQIIIKKQNSRNLIDDQKLSRINKINEFKKNIIDNGSNRRRNVIKLTNSNSEKKKEPFKEEFTNKRKSSDSNLIKSSLSGQKKNESLDFIVNESNRSFIQRRGRYKSKTFNDIDLFPKKPNFFPENVDEYEHNYSAPLDKFDFHNNNINLQRSPLNYSNKRKNFFKLNENNNIHKTEEKKNRFNFETPKENSGNRKIYSHLNPLSNNNDLNDNNNEEEDEKIGKHARVIKNNYTTRGRTIKEKIVKETKHITLEPGQTIKPKIITKRKLKPNNTIVKNEDGSESVVVENTILTTVIVNEIVDSSELYHDDYPLDVQLVKQYITKIYKTEIENYPYRGNKYF